MFCSKCGNEINDEALICPNCGCKTENFILPDNNPNYSTVPPTQLNQFDYAYSKSSLSNAKVLGIVGIIGGILIPLIGWICGAIGFSKANQLLRRYPTDSEVISCKNINIGAIVAGSVMFVINMIIIFSML
ncbi:MAG: zinc ribbon domain-containing protein [Eubacterium sp.]|nr:zinc ribbon domain-containing protein [Eubacterium sp.]